MLHQPLLWFIAVSLDLQVELTETQNASENILTVFTDGLAKLNDAPTVDGSLRKLVQSQECDCSPQNAPPCKKCTTSRKNQIMNLLKSGMHPDTDQSETGSTPLMIAAACGNTDSIIDFLMFGADINLQDDKTEESQKCTALHLAVLSKQADAVKLLASLGAKTDIPMRDGKTVEDLIKKATGVDGMLSSDIAGVVTAFFEGKSQRQHFLELPFRACFEGVQELVGLDLSQVRPETHCATIL